MKNNHLILTWIVVAAAAGNLCAQTLSTDKSSLSFAALVGGSPVSQTLNVSSSGGTSNFLVFPNASWLTVNPSSGTTPAALTVTADPSGLKAGTYSITLSVVGLNTVSVAVTFAVGAIGVSPSSLQFTYQVGSPNVPPTQPVSLIGQFTTFNATATTASGAAWLAVIPASGESPGTLSVLLNPTVLASLSPGTYTGTVTITPTSGGNNVTSSVAVTLVVAPTPAVSVNPSSLAFNIQIGGANNTTQQALTVSNGGSQPLAFSLTASNNAGAGKTWLAATPASGSIAANGSVQAAVSVDAAGLGAGSYGGKVTVSTPGGSPSSQDVAVNLLVSNSPLLAVPSATLNFTYQLGGPAPAAQSVTATSTNVAPDSPTGQMPLAITAATSNNSGSWLVVPVAAVTGTPFSVSVSPAGLAPGTYTGTITVTGAGAGNGPQQIPVVLKVSADPLLMSSASSLTFVYQIGQALPSAQNVSLTSSTGAPLNYTATVSTANGGNTWLTLSGSGTGTTDAAQGVSVNPAGLGAGTYNGTVTISAINPATGGSALNSPLAIAVKVYVSAGPLLAVGPPAPVAFTTPLGNATALVRTVTLASTSATQQLNYTATAASGSNWLAVSPPAGSTSPGGNTLNIFATPGGLAAGTYTGTITVTATGPGSSAVDDSPYTIPVALQVTAGSLMLDQNSLSFTQTLGGAAPAAQTVAMAFGGQGLTFIASATASPAGWLSVTPSSGAIPGSISVKADGTNLTAGTYTGVVAVASVGPNGTPVSGSPARVAVTLTVNAASISATPATLSFTQVAGGAAPLSQAITVTSAPSSVNFTVSASADNGLTWLSATPASGTTSGTVQVSASAGSLAPGAYKGTVTITSAGATGSPISIPVTLTVLTAQTLTATPASLSFQYTIGAAAPGTQTVQVTSSGSGIPIAVTTSDSWLQVSAPPASTPATLTVSINTQGLAAGSYTGTVTITSPNAAAPASVTVSLAVASIPTPLLGGIANAGSYATGAISPGENIVIFGTGIGPDTLTFGQVTGGVMATVAGGTRVLFDGIASPVYYASANQTSVFVPYDIAGRVTTNVVVEYQGVRSAAIPYNVLAAVPGIYTLNKQGSGPGAIVNQDYTINGPSAPAPKGSVVQVYMTGEGQTSPPGQNGAISPIDGSLLKRPVTTPVTATVGGFPANVPYAGSAPGSPNGVMQANVEIPANAPSGPAAIVITVGTASTQGGVTVTVK